MCVIQQQRIIKQDGEAIQDDTQTDYVLKARRVTGQIDLRFRQRRSEQTI